MNLTTSTALTTIEQLKSTLSIEYTNNDETIENTMAALLSNSKNSNDDNLLYTMEQMELIRRLKKTGITADAVIKAFQELEQVETDLQFVHHTNQLEEEQQQHSEAALSTASMLLNNNNNNNFEKIEDDLKNYEKTSANSYKHSQKTSINSIEFNSESTQYQQQQHSNQVEIASLNNSTLSFYTTPIASTLNESTSNYIFDLKANCEAKTETLQNEFNLENCSSNNNTSFLIQKLQQQFSANAKKDNNNEQVLNQLNGSLASINIDTVEMLKTLLLSTQNIREQKNLATAKKLNREQSPSLMSPPPSKNRRYSSVWSTPSSPSSLQQHDIIDNNLNVNCSTSATALITVLSHNLKNNVENNALGFISKPDIKNSNSSNSEQFINQLNQNNAECAATTSSCASSPLKIKNEDEEMDEDNMSSYQQQRRNSIILPASADSTFDSDQITISHYHQQQAQLQNIAIAAVAQQQQNSTTTKLKSDNDNILNFTNEQQAANNLNNLLSSYALLSGANNFNGSIGNQLSTKKNEELNIAQHFLLPTTVNNIPVTNSNIFSNVFSQSLPQTCSSSLVAMQTSSSPLSTTSSSPSAINAQTTTSALGCSSSSGGDQNSSYCSFDNININNSCRPIRSRRTPMKDITTLDNPAELEEFMRNGEESCINDMKQFITQFSLRQTTVAMMTGVSQPYISKLLNGNHRELSMRCRKNIYSWYLNCRRHPAKLALFTQDPSSRLETNGDGELIPQRRERYVFRPLLIKILEAYFAQSQFPDNAKRMEIAQACNEALKMNKKGVQLMPKEVVTPQVIANWFANKRKENRRKSHDETGSSFNAASLSLGLTASGTFNLQNTSQHYQAPPSSAPSALAFQLSNVATTGNILDSLQQSSFQHQSFFENISSSILVANSAAAATSNNSPQFLSSPLSATENTSSNNDCNKLLRRASNAGISFDANKSNIINDNNKYTSAILANIEAFRAAAAAAISSTTSNNNNNSENKSAEINELKKKVSVSQNILDNFFNNQQHFDFLNQNNSQIDVVIKNTTSPFANEDSDIDNLSINKTLQIGHSNDNTNKLNFEYINENNNDNNVDNDEEENELNNSKHKFSKENNHNDYEDYENNSNNLEDFHHNQKFNVDNNKLKILPSITADLVFKNSNVKDLSLSMLQKNIQNEINEKYEEINLTVEKAPDEKQQNSSEYYNNNSENKNISSTSNNNSRINMASIFQSHLQQHNTESTFHHENDIVVEQQKICHQKQQLVAE